MPKLLSERIRLVDDSAEIESVSRLLFELRREFHVDVIEDSGKLIFSKDLSRELREQIHGVHADLKRLAFGFNHQVQVEIDGKRSTSVLRSLRKRVSDATCRLVLSQLEGIFRYYTSVSFDAQVPDTNTPSELISIFDRLVNDPRYLEYSKSISDISSPDTRKSALVKLRKYARSAASKKSLPVAWDYVTKILRVWTGGPLPESAELGRLIGARELPPLVDMTEARTRAIDKWRVSDTSRPLRRDGSPYSDENIYWLPPLESMKANRPDSAFLSDRWHSCGYSKSCRSSEPSDKTQANAKMKSRARRVGYLSTPLKEWREGASSGRSGLTQGWWAIDSAMWTP